jgi:probable rRNA maturation factor
VNDAGPNLNLRNRQRARRLDLDLARRITTTLLRGLMGLEDFDLGVLLVGAAEMTRLNRAFLDRAGPTDVLCFDYRDTTAPPGRPRASPRRAARRDVTHAATRPTSLRAEIVVCVDEAVAQARRFRTTWQAEVVRYIVHGLLHLCGFDDHSPGRRRRMKRAEDRLLRQLARQFDFDGLGCAPKRSPSPQRRRGM